MFPTALMPLMMIVIPRATKKRVTVCCTHLKAKKGFEEVRLAQARHLLGVIEVPLPLPRSNLQDHPHHLNDHDGRPGGKMRAHNPRWRLQCWLGRTRLPAGKLVMTKKIIMNLRSLPSLPIIATITVPIIAIIATIMVPIIAVNIKVKEKGRLESAYNQILSKEPEYTTWKVMTMTLAISDDHYITQDHVRIQIHCSCEAMLPTRQRQWKRKTRSTSSSLTQRRCTARLFWICQKISVKNFCQA